MDDSLPIWQLETFRKIICCCSVTVCIWVMLQNASLVLHLGWHTSIWSSHRMLWLSSIWVGTLQYGHLTECLTCPPSGLTHFNMVIYVCVPHRTGLTLLLCLDPRAICVMHVDRCACTGLERSVSGLDRAFVEACLDQTFETAALFEVPQSTATWTRIKTIWNWGPLQLKSLKQSTWKTKRNGLHRFLPKASRMTSWFWK